MFYAGRDLAGLLPWRRDAREEKAAAVAKARELDIRRDEIGDLGLTRPFTPDKVAQLDRVLGVADELTRLPSPRRRRWCAVALLATEEVVVRFGGVRALSEASIEVDAGSGDRPDRPQRRREDHAVQRHHRTAGARLRAGSCSTASTSRSGPRSAGPDGHRPHLPEARGVHQPVGPGERARRRRAAQGLGPLVVQPRGGGRGAARARSASPDVAEYMVGTLPTGTARLVELARALAMNPRALLLDEPSSGLNEEETQAMAGLLRRLVADGLAVLLVEHDMSFVMGTCETIYVLDFGQHDRGRTAGGDPGGPGRPGRLSRVGGGPVTTPLLELRNVRAGYGTIDVLHGVEPRRRARSGVRPARAERRGQDHDDGRVQRPDRPVGRAARPARAGGDRHRSATRSPAPACASCPKGAASSRTSPWPRTCAWPPTRACRTRRCSTRPSPSSRSWPARRRQLAGHALGRRAADAVHVAGHGHRTRPAPARRAVDGTGPDHRRGALRPRRGAGARWAVDPHRRAVRPGGAGRVDGRVDHAARPHHPHRPTARRSPRSSPPPTSVRRPTPDAKEHQTVSETISSPRLQQFQAEVDQLRVTGGRANPERVGQTIGGVADG